MADTPKPVTDDPRLPKLAQTALKRVQALVRGNGLKTGAVRLTGHNLALYSFTAATHIQLMTKVEETRQPG